MTAHDNFIFMGYECNEKNGFTDYRYGYARFIHMPFNDSYQANYITDLEETTKDTIVVTNEEVVDLAYEYKACYDHHVVSTQLNSDLIMDEFNAFVANQGFSHFFDFTDDNADIKQATRNNRINVATQFLRNNGLRLSEFDRKYMTIRCIEYFNILNKDV